MTRRPPTTFKMRMDDEDPDTIIHEDFMEQRIEKLGHRISTMSVLIPLLLAAALLLAYIDLTKRVATFQTSGSTEVQTLSKNLEDRFTQLSEKQAKMEETLKKMPSSLQASTASLKTATDNLQKTTAAINKTTDALGKKVNAVEASLKKRIDTLNAGKADKAGIQEAAAKMEKTLDQMQKSLKSTTARVQTVGRNFGILEKAYNKELTNLNGSLGDLNELMLDLNKRMDQLSEKVAQINTDFTALSENHVGRNDLRVALDEEKAIYRQMISLISRNIDEELNALRTQLVELEKRFSSFNGKKAPISEIRRPKTVAPQPIANSPTPKPSPGKIIEQNIQ